MPSFRPISPAPVAPAVPSTSTVHGTVLSDPYAWLKAGNWKDVLKDPAALPGPIRDHLVAENAFSHAALADATELRAVLVREMRGRIREDDSSLPQADGPWLYATRHREGGQHPIAYRLPLGSGEGGVEEVLVDGDAEAEGHPFFTLEAVVHSPDHRLVAWSADVKGSELHTVRVRDLAAGTDREDEVRATTGEVIWDADARGFLYVAVDENHRPARVYHHALGDPQEADDLVLEERDPGFFVNLGRTQSGAFATISVNDHESSEVHLVDLALSGARPRLVAARATKVIYGVEHHPARGGELVILTNADGAEDFKIVVAPLATPERAHWRDLVPHRAGTMIRHHHVLARHMVRLEMEDARPRLVVRDWASGAEHTIAFAEEAYSLGMLPGFAFDTDSLRFSYSSLTTPAETYDYDLATRERALRKRQEVPSGHEPADYVTRRLFATAPDGEQVPVSLLHRRGMALDGSAPCLLYGYGSYGTMMPASFRSNVLSLVDRGFVYAIAHVRGGTEKGWHWYLDGKRERKTNTFSDFVACGEALAQAGYTRRGRIVAHGGSAGGMLMGAVANMAPDLFAGIVADVPFVDVMHTMLDGELPLTPPEWPEWGNPGADEAAFRTILAYSPYENVRPQRYPAILALGGLTDPRVTYWEPAKWVARLRATMTGGGPILMRINMEAGHAGAAGRFDRLEEIGLIYAFAIMAAEAVRAEGGPG